jgi:DNA-binding MurR/RpiR family transcriptional regulator
MTVNDMILEVKKLSPQRSDVLVFRLDNEPDPERVLETVKILRQHDIRSVLLTIADDSDIYVLNEEMMNRMGWFRQGSEVQP